MMLAQKYLEKTNMLQTIKRLRTDLTPKYGAGEAEAIIRLIFHNLKGWSTVDMLINENKTLSPYIVEKVDEIEQKLLNNIPIQYIVDEAYFYGMELYVNNSVLIPRPETEELIDLVVQSNKQPDLKVLEVGTGSGCISIALSRNLLFPEITSIDISKDALEVAARNIKDLKIRNVKLLEADVFSYNAAPDSFDIIVSNPPYVCESEKLTMEPNVLEYEPHIALFVPDDDPLKYYKRIGIIAKTALKSGGKMYFEINPLHADSLRALFNMQGFVDIDLRLDIHGRKRFLTCIKP